MNENRPWDKESIQYMNLIKNNCTKLIEDYKKKHKKIKKNFCTYH